MFINLNWDERKKKYVTHTRSVKYICENLDQKELFLIINLRMVREKKGLNCMIIHTYCLLIETVEMHCLMLKQENMRSGHGELEFSSCMFKLM